MDLYYLKLVALFMSCYFQTGQTLRCYTCTVTSLSPDTRCNSTVKTCASEETYCNVYTSKGSDNMYDFTRDCVTAQVCQPNYCKDTIIGMYGKTNCSVSCCQKDLCNQSITSRNMPFIPVVLTMLVGVLFLK